MFRTTGKLRFINNSGGEFVPNVLDPAFTNDSQLVLRFGSDGVYTPWVVKEEHINSQVPFCIGKDSGIILSGDYMVEDTAPEDVDILLVASYNNGYPSYLQHIGVKNLRTGTITNTTESGATPFTVKSPFTDDAPSLVCCDEERGFIYGLQYDYSADGITITRWSYDYQSAETRVLGFPIPQLGSDFRGIGLSCDGSILTITWYTYEFPYKTEYNWETNQITTKKLPISSYIWDGFEYLGSYGSKKLVILKLQNQYNIYIYILSETDMVKVYKLDTTNDENNMQLNPLHDIFGRLWFALIYRYNDDRPTIINLCNLRGVKQSIRCPLRGYNKTMWLDDNGLVFTYKQDIPQRCNPPFNRIVQRCISVKDGLKHTSEILGALPITPFSTTPQYYLRQEMKLRNKIVGIYTDYNSYTSSQQTKVSVYEIDTTTGQSQVTYETTLSSFIKWPSNLSAFSSALTLLKAKHSHNKDILALPNGITKNKNNVNLSFDFKNDVDLDDLKCTIDWGDGTSTTYLSNGKIMPTITDFAVTNALETTSSRIRISIKTPTNFSVTFDDPDMCIQSFLFYPGGTESPLWINIQNPTINGAKVTQTFSYQYFTVIKKVPQITKIRTKDNKIYSIFFPFAFIKKYLSGIASNSYITIQYTDSYFGDCVPTTSEIVSTASFPGTSTFVRVNVTAPNIVSKINAVWYVLEARSARRVYSDIHHNDVLELPFFCARQYHMLQYNVTLIDGTVLSYDAYSGVVSARSEASSYTVHTYSDDMCLVECTPSYFNEGPSDSNEILIDLGPRKYLHYDEIVDVTDTSCQTDFMIIPSSFTTSEKLYMSWWWQNKTNNTFCPLGRIFYVNSFAKVRDNEELCNAKMNQTPITYAPVLSTKLLVTQRPIPEFPAVDYDGYSLAILDAPSKTIAKIMRARFIRGRGFAKLKIGHNGNYSYRNITVYVNENMVKSVSYECYISVNMTDIALELKDEINTIDVVVTIFPTMDASEEVLSNMKMYVRCSNLRPISFFEESSDTPPGIEQSYMCPLGTNVSHILRMPIEKGYYAVRLWIKRIGGSETPFALYENLDNAVIGSYNPTRIQSYSYWWINTDKYPENEWVSQIIYFKYTEEHDLTIKTYPNTVAGTLYVAYEKLSDCVWLPIRSFKDDFDGHKAVTTPPNIYMSDYMQNYTNTNRFYWDMENIPSTATMMSFYAKVVKHPWSTIGNYESVALEFYTSDWDYLSRVDLLNVNNTGFCTFDTTEWVRIDLPLPEGTQIVELYQNSYQSADWQFLMTEPEFIDPYAVLTKRVGLPQGTVIDYGSWALDPTHQYNGFPTYKSNTITHNQSTSFSFDVTVSEFCVFACYNAVSSESGYDFLKIYVDNVVKTVRSGDYADDWKKLTVPLDVGTHTIKIEYAKDYSVSAGLDCAWVSDFHLLVKEN